MPAMCREAGQCCWRGACSVLCPSAKAPLLSQLQREEPEKLPSSPQHPVTSYSCLQFQKSWKSYTGDFSPVNVRLSLPAGPFLCNYVQLWKAPAPRWSSTCSHSWGAGHGTGGRGPVKDQAHPGSRMLAALCPPQGHPAPCPAVCQKSPIF